MRNTEHGTPSAVAGSWDASWSPARALALPLGAGAPRFGCQPPTSVTCLVGGRAALLTRDRLGRRTPEPLTAVPGVPQAPRPGCATRHRFTPAVLRGSARARPGRGWAGPASPPKAGMSTRSEDLPSFSTKTLLSPCSGGKARGQYLSQREEPPPERAGEGKGLWSPGTATY